MDFGLLVATGFPNMPQRPQPETLGEGGSVVGEDTLMVLYARPVVPVDRLRWSVGSLSLDSTGLLPSWLNCSCMNLSSQTKPEEPCLLKDVVDL